MTPCYQTVERHHVVGQIPRNYEGLCAEGAEEAGQAMTIISTSC